MERDPRLDALAETRARIAAMEKLLDELPDLFESKFRQRLQPLLEQQQRLLEDNAQLQRQLQAQAQRQPRLLKLIRPDDDVPPTAGSAGPTHR